MDLKKQRNGSVVLNIPQRDILFAALEDFESDRKNVLKQDRLFDALENFVDFVILYCKTELSGSSYCFDHVIPQIFVLRFKSKQQWRQFLRSSLYVLQLYAECLKKYKLHRKNVHQYRSLILNLLCDVEWLFVNHELSNKNVSGLTCTCGASRILSTKDMQFSMNELFFIDDCDDLASFDMRDVKPNVMFIIRQFLETLGKNLIGFESIKDANGKPIHKFTQVAWEYLGTGNAIVRSCIANTPIQISSILAINKWANSFVHARHLHATYVQFYALDAINHLMEMPSNGIKIYNNKTIYNTLFGDFRIEHYNDLKSDFEAYIRNKHASAIIEWLPLDKVGAYILSL